MRQHTRPALLILALTLAGATAAAAQGSGKGEIDIVDNAVNSADHTTLVAAVKAAGLVETLKGAGPFTVFAPTNAAFAALLEATVPSLLKPENQEQLTKVLTYHVVPGRWDAAAHMKAIKKGDGKAAPTTANGESLWAMMNGDRNVVDRS